MFSLAFTSSETKSIADLPYWAETLRALHWGKGVIDSCNSVPYRESHIGTGTVLKFVTKSQLSVPLRKDSLNPLIIRPIYQKIEYRILADIAATKRSLYRGGVCIRGESGVGKSTCLWYLLIAMMRQGHEVLWVHEHPEELVLFTADGCTLVSLPYLRSRNADSTPLIILWDAQAGTVIPKIYADQDVRNYVVLATSSDGLTSTKWAQSDCVVHATVETFHREEVACLEVENPMVWRKPEGFYDLLTSFDKLREYGPAPFSLLVLKQNDVKIREGTHISRRFFEHRHYIDKI